MILRKSKSTKIVWEDDPDKMWVEIKVLSPKDQMNVRSSCITNELVDGETIQKLDPFKQKPLECFLCITNFGNTWEDEEKTRPLKYTPKNKQACIDRIDDFVDFVHENLMIITNKKAAKKAALKENRTKN